MSSNSKYKELEKWLNGDSSWGSGRSLWGDDADNSAHQSNLENKDSDWLAAFSNFGSHSEGHDHHHLGPCEPPPSAGGSGGGTSPGGSDSGSGGNSGTGGSGQTGTGSATGSSSSSGGSNSSSGGSSTSTGGSSLGGSTPPTIKTHWSLSDGSKNQNPDLKTPMIFAVGTKVSHYEAPEFENQATGDGIDDVLKYKNHSNSVNVATGSGSSLTGTSSGTGNGNAQKSADTVTQHWALSDTAAGSNSTPVETKPYVIEGVHAPASRYVAPEGANAYLSTAGANLLIQQMTSFGGNGQTASFSNFSSTPGQQITSILHAPSSSH